MVQTHPQLLTIKETAKVLRCSEWTVRAKVSSGQIPSLRLGDRPKSAIRIPAVALDDWLNREPAP